MPPASRQSVTKGRWRAVALSLLVHALIVAAAVLGWFTWKHEPPMQALAVEGSLVDPREIKGIEKLPEAAPEPPPPEPAPEPVPEPEPEPTPPEEQGPPKPDPAEIERRQEEERQAAEKLEQEKQQQLEREKEQEQLRLDAEKKEAEKQAAAKAAAEKAAAEKAAADKKAAEKKKAEEAAAAKKEAEEKARRAAQEELRRSLEAEERANAALNSAEGSRWQNSISAKIARAWNRPPSAVVGTTCLVLVTQVPGAIGAEVTNVRVDSCNPNEAALRQSVENAVLAASPLPMPPPGVPFVRNLEITFAPDR